MKNLKKPEIDAIVARVMELGIHESRVTLLQLIGTMQAYAYGPYASAPYRSHAKFFFKKLEKNIVQFDGLKNPEGSEEPPIKEPNQ